MDLSSTHLVSDLGADKPPVGFRQGGDYVGVRVPLQVTGLPAGTRTRIENLSMSFQVPDGTTWNAEEFSWENPEGPDQEFWIRSGFYGAAYLTHNDVPVKVHGTLYLTVFGNPHTTQVPFGDHFVPVAQVGLCSATESYIDGSDRRTYLSVICNSAFRSPTVMVSYQFVKPSDEVPNENNRSAMQVQLPSFPFLNRGQVSFSPFPAELRISPVSQDFRQSWVSTPWDHAVVETLEPVGHVRFDFDIDLGKVPMHRRNNNEKIRP